MPDRGTSRPSAAGEKDNATRRTARRRHIGRDRVLPSAARGKRPRSCWNPCDAGFAIGALLAGVVADALGVRAAVWTVAALIAASGLVVAVRMHETHHRPQPPLRRQKEAAMGDRPKNALYAEFAEFGKALASPKRLELLDLLAQGPRGVDDLAAAADRGTAVQRTSRPCAKRD
jgi:hypothetical protein